MADPTFSPPASRNLALPIALAALLILGGAFLFFRHTPSTDAIINIPRATTWQAHTVFKSESIVVGRDTAQDDLYVLATVHVDDKLSIPLFIKDLTATLTTATGDTLAASAIEQTDLAPLYTTYPALKAIAATPLARETTVAPHAAAEGMVLLRFPITEDAWTHRQSATLTVDFYRQPPLTTTIPKP